MPPDAIRHPQRAVRKLISPLLRWFSANARDLPWRRARDPYAIWISEIMLQQTQVKTVIPYWERWMRELPTIRSAAKASPAKLHKLWEGLGYYNRVRNLRKAAQKMVAQHGGKFPKRFDDILALPGIGRYTAGAIASIAFNQPRPILDGNVSRVLTRIHGIAIDPREKETNARLWQLATELVAQATPNTQHASAEEWRTRTKNEDDWTCSQLNQSLMELGALVCTPRSPDCPACPIRKHCVAFRERRQEELPALGERKAPIRRRLIAFVIECNGKFFVRQRPDGVVNAYLWEFPNVEAPRALSSRRRDSRSILKQLAGETLVLPSRRFLLADTKSLCTVKHSITRYRITLEAYPARLAKPRCQPDGRWLTLPQLNKLAFTSAHKKILAHIGAPVSSMVR